MFIVDTRNHERRGLTCGDRDYVLDPREFSLQRSGGFIDGKAARNERPDGGWPALDERSDVGNGLLEMHGRGVDGSENDLVFQDMVVHQRVGVHRNGSLTTG